MTSMQAENSASLMAFGNMFCSGLASDGSRPVTVMRGYCESMAQIGKLSVG